MGVRWCAEWGREIETNWFFEENNSSARASHFLVHFSARASHFLVHFSARYDVNHIMRKVPTDENYACGIRSSPRGGRSPFT